MVTEVRRNLDPLREFIGKRERISHGALYYLEGLPNTEATADNIRHFCVGAGDLNPLWLDDDHGAKSPWGSRIAPPTWLYTVDWGIAPIMGASIGASTGPGAEAARKALESTWGPGTGAGAGGGIGGYGGSSWTFNEVVRVGDLFYVEKYLDSVEEKDTRTLGPTGFITGATEFYRQDGALVAKLKGTMIMSLTSGSSQEGAFAALAKLAPPEPEGELPDFALEKVVRRGSTFRYWDDVEVGEEITPLDKGRLTVSEVARWFGMNARPLRTHQGEHGSSYHYDVDKARDRGFPTGFDEGPQRSTWVGQAVTDWMGDAGFLSKLTVKLGTFNFIGRSTTIRGEVSGKSLDNNEPLVDLELHAEHGDGTTYTTAQATVRLPRRSDK